MQKHQRSVFEARLSERQSTLLRRIGFGLLLISALWCVTVTDWALGLTIFCGIATIASVSVIAILTFKPRWLRLIFWVRSPE